MVGRNLNGRGFVRIAPLRGRAGWSIASAMSASLSRRSVLAGVAASIVSLPARGQSGAGLRTLEARPGKARLSAAGEADILGFDGAVPGPLLRYKQGDALAVRLLNKTDQPLTLHWQGMRGDNAMDGVAPLTQPAVASGGQFDYRRTLTDPGLFCYRPSVWGTTPELVGRGLKGLLVVDEATPLSADADVILALDDWRLDAKGALEGGFKDAKDVIGDGRVGPALAVNGKAAPASFDAAPGARVRLRLANLANARIMLLTIEGARPYTIAIDSQPCDAFEPVRRTIPAAPGARFELMFDMPQAETATVKLLLGTVHAGGKDEQTLAVFTARGAKAAGRPPIASLPQNPALPPEIKLAQSKKVDLVIEAHPGATPSWTINGVKTAAYAGEPLFRVKRGTPVTLGFVNKSPVALAMHVHGCAARLLHDLDDGWEPYWRNAIIVSASKTKHIAFITDSPGKWAVHDDILEHEAAGLATWFAVD